MTDYHIYGRPFAGSLIAEFLFTAAACPYTISFPDEAERQSAEFLSKNPTGRIPVLVCPEGHSLFESLAIVHHITERFDGLAPTSAGADETVFELNYASSNNCLPSLSPTAPHIITGLRMILTASKPAREMNDTLFDYLKANYPLICWAAMSVQLISICMLTRWEPQKEQMRTNRPKLSAFCDQMRSHKVVESVLVNQPRKK